MSVYSLFHKGQLLVFCNYSSSLWGSMMPFIFPILSTVLKCSSAEKSSVVNNSMA